MCQYREEMCKETVINEKKKPQNVLAETVQLYTIFFINILIYLLYTDGCIKQGPILAED